MAKSWVILGAAVAIGAAAFMHSKPAAAHQWVAPATSYCHGTYFGGGDCCGNSARGLFTSGLFGGCGCGSWQHPAGAYELHGPAPYYTRPYVRPYYPHLTHPYLGPYYRHYYRSHVMHHGVYHGHSDYHRHGVYRAHHNNAHMRH